MKAKLIYNLDELDDKTSHLRAIKSLDLTLCLWDLDQDLRAKIKYAPDDMSEDTYKAYEDVRTTLHQLMSKYSLNFDDILI
jgi:hypothetical protein